MTRDPESYEALEEDYQIALRERDEARANADQLRAEVGECHLMISRDASEYQLKTTWEPTSLPPRVQRIFKRAEQLKAQVRALSDVLEEAYDLFDAGQSCASAYERGDTLECRIQHERAEGIKERMREALATPPTHGGQG